MFFEIVWLILLSVLFYHLGFAVFNIKQWQWLAWIVLALTFAFITLLLFTLVAPATYFYGISLVVSLVSTFVGYISEKRRSSGGKQ